MQLIVSTILKVSDKLNL